MRVVVGMSGIALSPVPDRSYRSLRIALSRSYGLDLGQISLRHFGRVRPFNQRSIKVMVEGWRAFCRHEKARTVSGRPSGPVWRRCLRKESAAAGQRRNAVICSRCGASDLSSREKSGQHDSAIQARPRGSLDRSQNPTASASRPCARAGR